MRIVIVGAGKVGAELAERLSLEDHDVVVIEKNPKVLELVSTHLDLLGIEGNGATREVQAEAGMDKADLAIACTSSDELNILTCLMAKKAGASQTIARVRNPEYRQELQFLREELGLSMAVNPDYAAASELFRMLRMPNALHIDVFPNSRMELVEIRVQEGSPLHGMSLIDLRSRYKAKVLVSTVDRAGEVIIPKGPFRLTVGDRLTVAATPDQIELFFDEIGILRRAARNVFLVGGSRIAQYLSRMLLDVGARVSIIDQNEARCLDLSEEMPKAMIIHGDGTDQKVLLEEGLEGADALVALTGMDEQNIILSMLASRYVPQVIAKVNRDSLLGMDSITESISVVSPKRITANQIMGYVRGMQNSFGSNVETLHRLLDERVEALEFKVSPYFEATGVPLKDLRFKENLLVVSIAREGKTILPGGLDVFKTGDRVVVVTTNTQLRDLFDILEA